MRGKNMIRGLSYLCKTLKGIFNRPIEMVEVGSFSGESAVIFHRELEFIKFSAVDLWKEEGHYANTNMLRIEEVFDSRTKTFGINKLKMSSVEGAKTFENASLDFVYIDADHTYECVYEDIRAWLPKIKIGGYIGGHDYGIRRWPGVKRAVKELLGNPDMTFIDNSWIIEVSGNKLSETLGWQDYITKNGIASIDS